MILSSLKRAKIRRHPHELFRPVYCCSHIYIYIYNIVLVTKTRLIILQINNQFVTNKFNILARRRKMPETKKKKKDKQNMKTINQ